jgi:hypothetical protein
MADSEVVVRLISPCGGDHCYSFAIDSQAVDVGGLERGDSKCEEQSK